MGNPVASVVEQPNRMENENDEFITIGKIVRPFGVHGEVRVYPLSDVPGRFDALSDVVLAANGHRTPTTVTRIRQAGGTYIMGFSAFSTPEEAASFRGAWLQVPCDPTVAPPPGHYYQYQLIGMTVRDARDRELGILEEVHDYPHHHLFIVRNGKKEHVIPAVRQIVIDVDVDRRIMIVKVPEEE